MTNTQERLVSLGFARIRREPQCWRTSRIEHEAAAERDDRLDRVPLDPPGRHLLLRWRDALALDPRPSPFRVSRIAR